MEGHTSCCRCDPSELPKPFCVLVNGEASYYFEPDQVAQWQTTPGRPKSDIRKQMSDSMGLNFVYWLRPVEGAGAKKASSQYPEGAVLMRFHPILVRLGYVQAYHYTIADTVMEAIIQSLGIVTGSGGLSCVYESTGSMGRLRSQPLYGGGKAVPGHSSTSTFFIQPLPPSEELVRLLPERLQPAVLEYLYAAGVLRPSDQSLTATPCSSVCPSPAPSEVPCLLETCYYEDTDGDDEPDLAPEPASEPQDALMVDALMALKHFLPAASESPAPKPLVEVVRPTATRDAASQTTPPSTPKQHEVGCQVGDPFHVGEEEELVFVFEGMSDKPIRPKILYAFEKHKDAADAAASAQSPFTAEQGKRKRNLSPNRRSTRSHPGAELYVGNYLPC